MQMDRKKHRKNRTGGGVGILVAQEIAKHAIEDNINDDIEGVETQWTPGKWNNWKSKRTIRNTWQPN